MGLLKKWRRKKTAKKPFPSQWFKIIEWNVPFYNKLPKEDRLELHRHIQIFLSEKRFEGCAGLEITDEIKVTIAANACILLLHRKTDYYPGLTTILVYPSAFVARRKKYLPSGVLIEVPEALSGESWHRGPVIISWDEVRHRTSDARLAESAKRADGGHNIVFHEFAHQIDSSSGEGDSSEVLKNRSNFISWARVLQKDFQKLRQAVADHQQTFLSSYGATDPAEFFAVATEFFFEKPRELQKLHPQLYDELKNFYHQDPAEL